VKKYVEYLNSTLCVDAETDIEISLEMLPLYLRSGYDYVAMQIFGTRFILAKPKEQYNLTILRKQILQLSKLMKLDCVLCLENVRIYTKEKMLAEGIPFIILQQQIFMPFLGVALSKKTSRELPKISRISTVTHKLLLRAVYDGWMKITLTEAANALGVSKMTVTRCFDELEVFELNLIKAEGKLRYFVWKDSRRKLWETVQPLFRTPIITVYRYGESLNLLKTKFGGISALCHYTMLDDNPYPTYAVSKDDKKALISEKLITIPEEEAPATVVQVIQYTVEYRDGTAVDPLTAILSLTNDEKKDPRVESAIEILLEECLDD
jgi:hypothetical protein